MGRDLISVKQLMTLLFLAMLSPGVQLTPGWAAERAGAAGWPGWGRFHCSFCWDGWCPP